MTTPKTSAIVATPVASIHSVRAVVASTDSTAAADDTAAAVAHLAPVICG